MLPTRTRRELPFAQSKQEALSASRARCAALAVASLARARLQPVDRSGGEIVIARSSAIRRSPASAFRWHVILYATTFPAAVQARLWRMNADFAAPRFGLRRFNEPRGPVPLRAPRSWRIPADCPCRSSLL